MGNLFNTIYMLICCLRLPLRPRTPSSRLELSSFVLDLQVSEGKPKSSDVSEARSQLPNSEPELLQILNTSDCTEAWVSSTTNSSLEFLS